MKSGTIVRLFVALLGIGFSLWACRYALHDLHAEILLLTANRAALRSDLSTANSAVAKALALQPDDYRLLETAARFDHRAGRVLHAQQLRAQAVRKRPGWPYAWMQLAQSYAVTAVSARQFEYAMQQSTRLGRNEKGIWSMMAMLALGQWQEKSDPKTKAIFTRALTVEHNTYPDILFGRAFTARRENVLCSVLGSIPDVVKWCREAAQVRQSCEEYAVMSAKHRQWCDDFYELARNLSRVRR